MQLSKSVAAPFCGTAVSSSGLAGSSLTHWLAACALTATLVEQISGRAIKQPDAPAGGALVRRQLSSGDLHDTDSSVTDPASWLLGPTETSTYSIFLWF
jgi:hypothetical protein